MNPLDIILNGAKKILDTGKGAAYDILTGGSNTTIARVNPTKPTFDLSKVSGEFTMPSMGMGGATTPLTIKPIAPIGSVPIQQEIKTYTPEMQKQNTTIYESDPIKILQQQQKMMESNGKQYYPENQFKIPGTIDKTITVTPQEKVIAQSLIMIPEMFARSIATLYGEIIGGGKTVNLGTDARRWGFDTPQYVTAQKEFEDEVLKGEDPLTAGLRVVSSKTLDVSIAGSFIASIAKVLSGALLKGGIETQFTAWNLFGKAKTIEEAKPFYLKLAKETHPDMPLGSNDAFSYIQKQWSLLNKEGIPNAVDFAKVKVGQSAELLGRQTPIQKGFLEKFAKPDITPKVSDLPPTKIAGELPGTAIVGKPQPKFGMQIQPVKKVGGVPEELPKIPETGKIEPLQEAKGKSLEEFVKAQQKVTKVSKQELKNMSPEDFINGDTIIVDGRYVIKIKYGEYNHPSLKTTVSDITKPAFKDELSSTAGIKGGRPYFIDDFISKRSGIVTKQSQLTSIWEQANKPVSKPLSQEARKYKTADEFVKAQTNAYHGSMDKGLKLKDEAIFLTDDFDSANTYAGGGYEWRGVKASGETTGFYAKKGKTLDLNETENVKKAFQDIYGSPKLKKLYDTIPENYHFIDKYDGDIRTMNPRSNASDFDDWLTMEAQSNPKIGMDGLKVRTGSYSFDEAGKEMRRELYDAFYAYGQPTRQSVYNNWEKLIKYSKEKGYDYIKHTTESPDASITFPETVALNPKKTLLTKSQLTAIWKEAQEIPKQISPIESVERGFVTSIKEAFPNLERIAGQYIPRTTDELSIKAKNLIADDIDIAEKLAFTGTDDKAVATGAELLKHYSKQAGIATDGAVKNALYDKAAKLGNDMAHKLTEQGRAIQAASILARLTPEGQVRFAAREIQKYNEGAKLKNKIPELTTDQSKNIIKEMKKIGEMKDGVEKAMKLHDLQNYISDLVPTTLYKKIIAVWKAGLLTGIKTSGVNIFSNVSHLITENIKNIPATMVDKVVSIFTKTRTKTISIQGILIGSKEGFGKGYRYFTTGFDERNIGAKLDYTRLNFGKGKLASGLQAYTDTVFRLLGSGDQPFYYAAKIISLYEQAKVSAINAGLKGKEAQEMINSVMKNPTDQMIKYASADAQTAVYQNPTLLGKAAKAIQGIPGGEILVPFGRTPSAVATQIFNYSPLGAVKTIFENLGKERFDQRKFAEGLGRSMTSIGTLALGAYLYSKGDMTTSRPTNKKEQKLWELEGKQANSIKIGGKWRQVQVLGPVGNLLLIGGSFQKAFDNSGSPSEAMAQGLADSTKSFTQQTFLTGVSNFIDAISDPSRNAEYVIGSTFASIIPTIVSDVARATDTKERRAATIFNKFELRIPGVRQTLEPQIDVLGEERARAGNILEVLADATRPTVEKVTPLIFELRRLFNLGIKVSPSLLGDKKGYSSLTLEQNTELWKKAGKVINSKLSKLIELPAYKDMNDEARGKNIDSFVRQAQTNAKAEMVKEVTSGLSGDLLRSRLSELKSSGLLSSTVYSKYLEIKDTSDFTPEDKSRISSINFQSMSKGGAQKVIDSFSESELKAYESVQQDKKNLEDAKKGIKPEITGTQSEKQLLNTVITYAKALGTDPITAFNRIFTGQRIRKVESGMVIVERMSLSASEAVKEKQGGKNPTMKLDHTVPLQLGGSNSEYNLKLVTTAEWASYTPVENAVTRSVKAGKISKKDAQGLISDFKNELISADEVYSKLK